MNLTIIGAGSHRVLGILRGALAVAGVLDGGEIRLCDRDVVRAEVMGRMLLKTPEQLRSGCRVVWGGDLDAALDGADVVGVILPASRPRSYTLGHEASYRDGFISSDNVSPNGALCAVKIGPTVLDIARRMEEHCPNAWLVNFVNPVAVLSGMVNHHTRIRCLGVCAGFTNHLWDIPRLLGRDELAQDLDVDTAGINHLSFISRGSWQEEDLFRALRRHLEAETKVGWKPPELQPWRSTRQKDNIRRSVLRLVRFWRELGVLIFSTEGDGMDHLMYEEAVEDYRSTYQAPSTGELERSLQRQGEERAEADRSFREWLDRDLDDAFWNEYGLTDPRFQRQDEDIFVRIFTGLAGVKETKIATSRPNRGAIIGIKDRHVVEYSQFLFKDEIRPAGIYEIPDVVHGLTSSLASHQTLLGDALAEEDPHLLAQALLAYPESSYSRPLRGLYKELFKFGEQEIKPSLARAIDFL